MNTCFVDYRITDEEYKNLSNENLNIIKVPKSNQLYDAINGHPDIQLNIISDSNIVLAKDSSLDVSNINNLNVYYSESKLYGTYPDNIFLNAVNLKDYFIHNLKYTDKTLLNLISNKTKINIKQGYGKCSCAIVSNNALITSDNGIYKTLKKYPIDVLLIPSGDIELYGLSHGFIGGACGLISKNKMAFYGNLKYHAYGKQIIEFLKKYNVEPIYLSDSPLIDRGSILTIF